MQYRISDIARIMGADRHGADDALINWLLIDSRSLCFPAETLFFAIRTNRNDGHRYIAELHKRGVRNFVVSTMPPNTDSLPDSNFLLVHDTLQALQTLAAYHRRQFDIPVVAITGSNGKTTVKEWLYQLLSPDYNVCRSPRSYNSQVGVPLSLWLLNNHNDMAIIEAGISNPNEMDNLNRMIRPTISVITNIGEAHQENFFTREGKCDEKLKLFKDCETAVINLQDEFICKVARQEVKDKVKCWPMVRSVEKHGSTATITFNLDGHTGQYTIPFIDNAAIENSVVCLATCASLGNKIDIDTICRRMSTLEPVAMRLEVKDGINGCTLINDTYNSDIHSLDIALDFMSRRPETPSGRRTLILSDILQSGEAPRTLYARVAHMAESRGIDKIIGVGNEIMSCAGYFKMESHFFRTTDELIQSEQFTHLADEFILIKGARQYHFDRLSDLLTLKVHQTILEVNLNALIDNLHYYKAFLQPETKIVCMVKASAYGIGALETSKTLQDQGVDYLAVAVADEGAELRRGGITANIIVMNPEMTSFKTLFDYRLEPEVYSFQLLEALIYAAEKEGITNFPIHIKLDTGMHRLGFNPETDIEQLIMRLSRQSALVPCSVFSHFAGSDDDQFDDFSRRQFALFENASNQLQAAYNHKILRHICNSAAIEHFPKYQLDMVRLGLGLYGINPRNNKIINNVATLKTTILQIRDVPAGDTIGYSRRGTVARDSRIAAIPIGYADGLNRQLGNGNCYCMVGGHKAPYVGNICMDVCMIDVTGIPCSEGDQAVIFGNDLPVTQLSDACHTIPYEILTSISPRVQRVYVQE
ncbi:MAG: bifunctional UDP-N-acetylmuramoyl-tripeptide:D-alanyl-D-alanine ligase/alanine racemase [Bacteroidaceae bacterium]|nr:bifunctional UDP-N-acetylmuramoyl-tripeptide:D-alanyl-D-alanine ligase/alanine racemase [Bacteroidaceae bacterium]